MAQKIKIIYNDIDNVSLSVVLLYD